MTMAWQVLLPLGLVKPRGPGRLGRIRRASGHVARNAAGGTDGSLWLDGPDRRVGRTRLGPAQCQ